MKILIIAPSWVGDMMMSQSLYKLIKQQDPSAIIDVLAPQWSLPLVAKMPEVNQSFVMDVTHGQFNFKRRRQLAQKLAENKYDQAFILPNSLKSALIPFLAKIPKRTGWKGEMRYCLLNDLRQNKERYPLMVERYCALAAPKNNMPVAGFDLPKPKIELDLAQQQAVIAKLVPDNLNPNLTKRGVVGFCPGAEFGPAKRWPHYHYAELAEKLIDANFDIYLFGSNKDNPACEEILAMLDNKAEYCLNLAGKTSLDEAINLIGACNVIVSNDSGLMHIAAALDVPLVALYGPTSPDFTPPLSSKAITIRLIDGYIKVRKTNNEFGYHQSLIDISPELVLEKIEDLLVY